MKLQTTITIPPQENPIDYSSKVLCMGSCFATHIGAQLEYFKFQNNINPFGILFHPVAIEKLLKRAIKERYFNDEDVFFYNERWHCFEVHSQFSSTSKEDLIASLNEALIVFKRSLQESSHFIFTFGTAWVYRHIESDTVVANCHKVPQPQFLKELLSPDDVSAVLLGIEEIVKSANPLATIINTVSPVRHIKDGITGNARSKAHLLAGVLEITAPSKNNFYFPSYEIMMDELRDYRFYAQDLIHPNETAIAIIWEKFNTAWVDPKTIPLQEKVDSIQKGLQHRPFDEKSEGHQTFLKNIKQKILEVQKELSNRELHW